MKRLSVLAIGLCMVLMFYGLQPATSNPGFPAVGDTYDYEMRVNLEAVNTTGTNPSYNIQMDMTHTIQNSSNDYYWANMTTTFVGPTELFGPLTGNTTWTAFCHEYASAGDIRYLWSIDYLNWSDFISSTAPYDYWFIPQQTLPGEWLWFGTYQDDGDYMAFAMQVGQGTSLFVSGVTLDTVSIGFRFDQHINATADPGAQMYDMTGWFNMSWEWSLGFLADVSFDIHLNMNPNHNSNFNITSADIEGYYRLVSFTTQDTPIAMPNLAAAASMNMILMLVGGVALGLIIGIIIAYLMWKRGK